MNVFGRVANVAGSLAGVAKNVIGDAQAWNDESEVEALLSRISDAYLAEDRREAMAQLKELLRDNTEAQQAVGNMGLPVLADVLREDRDDLELVQGSLESLTYTFSAAATPANRVEAHPGLVNAELFARIPENVQLLLSMLEEEPVGINDFFVRYYTVQLLTALLNASSHRLQEAILSSPLGVVRLMDMLTEREAIRNEALLLLVALTRCNEEIQKIAAFEGAFDHVFNIVNEEGAADGGLVVQDSIELVNNLLRGNLANQRLFREMGFVTKLNAMLTPTSPEASLLDKLDPAGALLPSMQQNGIRPAVPPQKAANLLAALETVLLLAAAPSSNSEEQRATEQTHRATNQAKLLQLGLMDTLMALALKDGGVASPVVRSQALRALGELVAELNSNQEKLGTAVVNVNGANLPALQACLQVALYGQDAGERAAACHVIRCFCAHNPDGQSLLISTLAPLEVRYDPKNATFGGELVHALLGRGEPDVGAALQLSCRAAGVLQFLLEGNVQSKQRVLTIMLEIPASSSTPPEYLMPRCMKCVHEALKTGPRGRVAAALLLRLFIVWLKDCPTAVATFVNYPWHLPFITDIVAGRVIGPDPDITGLAALLLGLCLSHLQPSVLPPPQLTGRGTQLLAGPQAVTTPSQLLDIILARVAFSILIERFEALRESPLFLAASVRPKLPRAVTRETAAAFTAGKVAILDDTGAPQAATQDGSPGNDENPYDYTFTRLVMDLEVATKQTAMSLFHSASSSGGDSSNTPSALSQLQNMTDPKAVWDLVAQMEGEVNELRRRNRIMAEDLLRINPGAAMALASPSPKERTNSPARQPAPAAPSPPSQAEVETRVAAEMRAAKAEAESSALKQQVEVLQARLQNLQAEVEMVHMRADDAAATTAKHETDLSELSAAYNQLEMHAFKLEEQNRQMEGERQHLQQLAKEAQQKVMEAEQKAREAERDAKRKVMEAEQKAREAEQRAVGAAAAVAASHASTAGPGGVREEDVQRRVEAAVKEAKEESASALAELDEQLTDLLVCLGQEEQKNAIMSERLTELGEDVATLLQGLGDDLGGGESEED